MKLGKLGKVIKDSNKRLNILTDQECQLWVGTDKAMYAVEPELGLTKDNLLAICDIEKDKRKGYSIREAMTPDPRFTIYQMDGEEEDRLRLVALFEHTMILADREGNILGIDARLLAPVEHDNGLAFFARYDPHGLMAPAVAVFDDIMCGALIAPIREEDLARLQDLCRDVAGRKLIELMSEIEDNGEQMSLLEDGEN